MMTIKDFCRTPEFEESTHTYKVDGKPVPSVSELIRPLTDAAYRRIDPAVLEEAAALGTAVHSCTELDDRGELDEESVPEDCRGYLSAYRAWRGVFHPEFHGIERRLGCPRYAGTIDRIAKIGGEYWIVDIKTTSELHPHVGVQLAAYEKLAGSSLVIPNGKKCRRAALQLNADGTNRFREYKSLDDYTCLSALLAVYGWRQHHES